jgi:probable F420-dependent oxidoreductase
MRVAQPRRPANITHGKSAVRGRHAMKVCISVLGLEKWFGGDFAGLASLVTTADRLGVDQVSVVDHVTMGENLSAYPYGPFPGSSEMPWLEPMVQLATFASVTERIRLATGIIIGPLRPAAVLAKQIATLDVLSHGRVDIGLGVGWQKEEYEACGVPFEGRFGLMEEQVRACKLLWTQAPAAFAGQHVNFERTYSLPYPVQGADTPIWFGIAPSGRNLQRLAELGDGWLPMERDPEVLAAAIGVIKAAMAGKGRDPSRLQVRASYRIVAGANGKPDLEATLAQTATYAQAGVTTLRVEPGVFCKTLEDYAPFLQRVLAANG